MPDIHLFLDDVKYSLNDEDASLNWLKDLAKRELRTIDDVNIILTSDEKLLQINRDFLKHDFYTDIITFQNEGENLSGEIYISIDRVRENAETCNTTIDNELHRVMAHGLLHMIGYKDKLSHEKATMRKKEKFYLNLRPI